MNNNNAIKVYWNYLNTDIFNLPGIYSLSLIIQPRDAREFKANNLLLFKCYKILTRLIESGC